MEKINQQEEIVIRPRRRPRRVLYMAITGGVILLLLPLFFYLPSLLVETEEEKIERQFKRGRNAAEKRNYALLAELVSESYDGAVGKSRQEALKIARSTLDQLEDFRITILTLEIEIRGADEAYLHSSFEASGYWIGSEIYRRIPLSGGMPKPVPGEVEMIFSRQGNVWRIIHAELDVGGVSYH